MVKIVLLLSFLLLTLISCAKPEDPITPAGDSSIFTMSGLIETPGYGVDMVVGDGKLYCANDMAGMIVIDLETDSIVTHYSPDGTNSISLVRYYEKTDVVVFCDRFGSYSKVGVCEFEDNEVIHMHKQTGNTLNVREIVLSEGEENNFFLTWVNYSDNKTTLSYKFDVQMLDGHYNYISPYLTFTFDNKVECFELETDSLIYLSNEQLGVLKFNVNSGSTIASFNTPGEPLDMKIVDELIYLASRQDGLAIINKESGELLFSNDTSGYAQHLAFSENLLALSSGGGGLYLYDITNRLKPELLEIYDDLDYCYSSVIIGSKIYVSTRKGVKILNINMG